MQTHVKVLGVLFIALSAICICAAIFFFIAFAIGASATAANADPHDTAIALPIIGAVGTAFVAFLVVLSIPGIVVGIGLLNFRPWARIVGIALSALNLINIPFGTLLGIYGLWVLLNSETEPLFLPRSKNLTV
ncbi:MAG TPA: hypothetical protein VL484_17070 [Vicinamibacterales bacterium]|jgi:hypothetical protein|nr:hypothetical protein [Vicinamibacterales bacterium]